MKVAGVEAVPYALPFREPYVTARGRLERREMVLVRLRADEGLEGLGEAVAMSLRGGTDAPALAREISDVAAPALVSTEVGTGLPGLPPAGLSPPARAAVEIAALDLAAKLANVPL